MFVFFFIERGNGKGMDVYYDREVWRWRFYFIIIGYFGFLLGKGIFWF